MNKNTTMILAAVAVVVVVAASCGVVFLGGSGSSSKESEIASQLQIRGNVNDDYTIDASDMTLLEDVLNGSKTLEEYPLADVNNDGKVDETDKTLLQDLIDRKSGTTVYIICLDRAGKSTTVQATYPLRNIVPYGTNIQLPLLYANGGQYVVGYFKSSYATAEGSIASTAVDLKGDTRQIPDSAWTNFTKLDGSLEGGVGALLVDYSGVAQITDARQADLDDAKIPTIIYSSADAKAEVTTVLTLGFLIGGDSEALGVKYAKESWEVFDLIKDKVGDLSDDKKTSYIGFNMYIYVCQNDSTFNTSGIEAGGIPYCKVNSEFAEKYKGASSVKMTSTEALSNYTDAGCLLNSRSMDWGLTEAKAKELIIGTWDHDNAGTPSTAFFKDFLDKLDYVNNLLPGGVKVAYMAHALYGDKFSESWADGILQKFINIGTDPLKDQTLNTIVAHIDKNTYDKAQGKVVASESAVDILSTFMSKVTGPFATGADSATYAFKNGSVAEKATIAVANGNTGGYSAAENTVLVQVTSEAKSLYETNKTDYDSQIGKQAMGATYTAVKVDSSKFNGVSGYYLNITSYNSASGHFTGYVGNVFFECYFYTKDAHTDADYQKVLDAMYSAIFETVKYSGPAIPEDVPAGTYVGAGHIADLFAETREAWTISSESTATEGKLIFHYNSSSGTAYEVPVTVYVGADADSKYATSAAVVAGMEGKNSMSSKYPYSVTDTSSLTSVKCTAVNSQMSATGYTLYVMQYGYIVFDASEVKSYVKSATAAAALVEELADIANFLQRADVVATSLEVVDGETMTVKEGATAENATVVFHYTSSSGAKTVEYTIYSGSDADAKYSAAAANVTGNDGQPSMGSKYPYSAVDTSSITGVTCVAESSQMSASGYALFAMKSGNVVVNASEGKLYFSSTDVPTVFKEYLAVVAGAVTA